MLHRKMPRGVYERTDGRAKSFRIMLTIAGRRVSRSFTTEREAVVVRLAYRFAALLFRRVAKRKAKKRSLADKRAADLNISGGNISRERDFAHALVSSWIQQTGRPAMVSNDGTRSDVLLGSTTANQFLPVQIKTTREAMKGHNDNLWGFYQVTGYASMPVVCWRDDCKNAWVFDGAALDKRGLQSLTLSPP